MRYEYDMAIIGAGSAGLVVAAGTAALGGKAVLFEESLMGGDCLNYGCVPSKSFLHGAHGAHRTKAVQSLGVHTALGGVDLADVMGYVHDVIESIAPHDSQERFEGLGVKVVRHKGVLVDGHTVEAGGKRYRAKSVIIATGSEAAIPPIAGLSEVPYYTNHNIFEMQTLPDRLLVLGAGPIGLELGQGFCHLGSTVTVIDRSSTLFSKDEPEVGPILKQRLEADGVQLCLQAAIGRVDKRGEEIVVTVTQDGKERQIVGDALLVSLGRKAVTKGLGLEEVGVTLAKNGQIVVDRHLRSSVPSIYACGDAAGPFQFTHMAGYQAGVVLQNALLGLRQTVDYSKVCWCTYTLPEVAHVGLSEAQAKQLKGSKTMRLPLKGNDRARAEDDLDGFLKVSVDRKGVLIGATLVGEKAGELIAPAALAVANKQKISAWNNVILPYPTQAEIYKTAASTYRKEGVKPWQTKLLLQIIGMRRKRA